MCRLPRDRITTIYNSVTDELRALVRCRRPPPWFPARRPPPGGSWCRPPGGIEGFPDADSSLRSCSPAAGCTAGLVILSRGSLRGDLVALAAALEVTEDVALPGFVRNPFAYMPRASVFALSSIWGGMVLVLVEALAGSCPVVSTDCYAGPTEILRPGGEMGPALWFPPETMRHRRLPSSPHSTIHPRANH